MNVTSMRTALAVVTSLLLLVGQTGCVGEPVLAPEREAVAQDEGSNGIAPAAASDWSDDSLLYSPDEVKRKKIPVKVKGIYVTGWSAGNGRFSSLLHLVNTTELNAMVIDVKEDEGRLTYKSSIPLAREINSDGVPLIPDIDKLIHTLEENHIYPIARIVCFKDPYLAGKKPRWAMQRKTGGVWLDQKGIMWIDPYRKEVWDYNIAIAKEAARKGFKEIQFDYVRFPDNGKRVDQEVAFYQQNGKPKRQVIADFLAYAKKQLEPYDVFISADIFGLVPSVTDDMGIGQKWELVTPQVDYICPMMYPSHYAPGTYGLPVPDAKPYETIVRGLADAQEKDKQVAAGGSQPAQIRPWYQDFTASWVKGHIPYGPEEVLAQIRAGKERGIDQYLIWNAGNIYSEGAWRQTDTR